MHELEHYELERRARYFESQGGRGEGVSVVFSVFYVVYIYISL